MKKYWGKLDLKGEVGMTTTLMITSLLLVSGAAATTLVDTNNDYQQQAEDTANQALMEISTGISVVDVLGHFDGKAIRTLDLLIRLNSGSPSINLETVTIVFTARDDARTYTLNATDLMNRFTAKQINIASGLPKWDGESACIMGTGDLIQITLQGVEVLPGQSCRVNLIPSLGQQNFVILDVPDAIIGNMVTLR